MENFYNEQFQEEIQEEEYLPTGDSLGDYLPVEENNSENFIQEIVNEYEIILDNSNVETLLLEIKDIQTEQLNRINIIGDFFYLLFICIIAYALFKFVWGLLSYERF